MLDNFLGPSFHTVEPRLTPDRGRSMRSRGPDETRKREPHRNRRSRLYSKVPVDEDQRGE